MNDEFNFDEARIRQAEKAMEEEDWKEAKRIDTPESYKGYVYSYPQGQHIAEANQRIAELMAEQKERIIRELCEDRNAYHLKYIKACGITVDDLRGKIKDSKGQVRDEVLKSWNKFPQPLTMGVTPTEIPEGSTEVYFWGVPGAGRTCMLAAMLNAAQRMGVYMPREGEGLGFMTDLATVFNSDPSAPAVPHLDALCADTLQSLPLSLLEIEDKSHYKEHKLSIVVSSGEVVELYSRRLQGLKDKTSYIKIPFNRLNSFLLDKTNSKYHFFVLDCNSYMEESRQAEYLQRVALYFQKYEIFNSTTAGIGIIVTKCDLLSPDNNEWPSLAEEYVNKFYPALLNKLKHIVGPKRYGGLGVNNGNVNIIPFSVGELFLRRFFLFNPEPAKKMVKTLMECTPAHKD